MISLDLAFAPVIALVMTVLLAAVYINLGIRFQGVRLFGVLLSGTWAGGTLIAPLGPPLWGVAWLPLCVAGLASAGLCLAGALLSRHMTRTVTAQLDGLAFRRGLNGACLMREIGPKNDMASTANHG